MNPLRMLLLRLSSDYEFLLRFQADPKPVYAAYHLTPDEVAAVEQRSSLWALLVSGLPLPSPLPSPTPPMPGAATTAPAVVVRVPIEDDDDDGDDDGDDDDDDGDDDDDDDDDRPPQPPPPHELPPQFIPPPQPGPPTPLVPPPPPSPPPHPLIPPIQLQLPYQLPPVIVRLILGSKSVISAPSEKALNLAASARAASGQDRLSSVRAMIKEL
jgi:hypothetical protein